MLISWLLATGLSVLLYSSGIFSLFTPLPIATLCLRRGGVAALISLLGASLLLYALYHFAGPVMITGKAPTLLTLPLIPLSPLFLLSQITFLGMLEFFYYGSLGLLLVWAVRFKKMEQGMGVILLGVTLVIILGTVLFNQIFQVSLLTKAREAIQGMFEQWVQLNSGSSKTDDGEIVLITQQHMPLFVNTLYYLLPALFVSGTLVSSALNLMILKRWVQPKQSFAWGDFSQWRLPEGSVWFSILAGGAFFLNHFLFHQPWVQWSALNLLVVTVVVYFFQGTSILSFFWNRSFPPLLRLLAYFLFFILFQIVAVIIALTGLFDFWFDFRRLRIRHNSSPPL